MTSDVNPFTDQKQVVRALSQQKTVCSDEVARGLAEIGQLKTYRKDERIATQGELGDELFYILSGSVRVVVNEHQYKVRHRGEMVGEMAIIEPGERRSADLVANDENTMLWVVGARRFLEKADERGEIWECVARELANRLRQRDQFFVPPNIKPTIFIASSSEGVSTLHAATAFLQRPEWEIRPWNEEGIFRPTLGTLEELERNAHEVDFAVIIVTPDDLRERRGELAFIPRDNVMIELGLFVGALERQRTFLLTSADPHLRLASDLDGVSALYFSTEAELERRLLEIERAIQRIGRMYRYCNVVA